MVFAGFCASTLAAACTASINLCAAGFTVVGTACLVTGAVGLTTGAACLTCGWSVNLIVVGLATTGVVGRGACLGVAIGWMVVVFVLAALIDAVGLIVVVDNFFVALIFACSSSNNIFAFDKSPI